jgi:hypothetical protein
MKRAYLANTNKYEDLSCEFHPTLEINYLRMKTSFIFLFVIPLMAPAQTTRNEDIFTGGNCTLSCMATVSNDSITCAYVSFDAKDDRLPTLKNYFTISYDAPQNVYVFLAELEKFSADESAKSAEISKHKVAIENVAGTKVVKVFDEHGLIFHRFSPKLITSIKTKFLEWAEKNKIKLE